MKTMRAMSWSLVLALTLWLGAPAAKAADAPEPMTGVLEAVHAASRRVVVDGVSYGLSSTVNIAWSDGTRLSLLELSPGPKVRIRVTAPEGDAEPVITEMKLLAD